MNWREVGGSIPPIPIFASMFNRENRRGDIRPKTVNTLTVVGRMSKLPSPGSIPGLRILPTYPKGYKGAVLKTDVPWRTWYVGSNPTVGVAKTGAYLS